CIANLRWAELRECALVPRRCARTLLVRQKGLGMSGSAAGYGVPDEARVVALVAEVDGARTEHGRRAELREARFPRIARLDGGFPQRGVEFPGCRKPRRARHLRQQDQFAS